MGEAGQDLQIRPIDLEVFRAEGDQADKFTEEKGR